jgi:hypothetical protein
MHVYPPFGTVPTNAQIRVIIPTEPSSITLLGPQNQNLAWASISSTNVPFYFLGAGAAMPARVRKISGTLATLIVEPAVPFVPNATYDLVVRTTSNEGTLTDFPVGRYTARSGPDVTPATLASVRSARVHHLAHAGYKEAWGPWIDLELTGAADDVGPFYYEIVDSASVPLATIDSLRFGSHDVCRASEVIVETKGVMKLGVRLVDAAGNASPIVPFTADADHPVTR